MMCIDNSQIMLAAYHGHAPLVKVLLQHGANPNSLNDRGQSPLAGAVFKNEEEVVEVTFISSFSALQSV
jgi:ankyrin repeat protein